MLFHERSPLASDMPNVFGTHSHLDTGGPEKLVAQIKLTNIFKNYGNTSFTHVVD